METNAKGEKKTEREIAQHTPVLLNEVLQALAPKPGEFVIDGTVGSGGHALPIIERTQPDGMFLGIDWDRQAVERLEAELKGRVSLKRFIIRAGNYRDLPDILRDEELRRADGLLLDLGFSSEQLALGRGFSFREDEPLLMTYDLERPPAYEVLAAMTKEEIATMIRDFSDERYARRISEAIWEEERKHPIVTAKHLREVVHRAVPKHYEGGRIDPATRTFQALRIYVNDELGNLETLLSRIRDVVRPGGRVAVISFHSKEDRLVKRAFQTLAVSGEAELLIKKPIRASVEEIEKNPRSRSAKLRAIKLT